MKKIIIVLMIFALCVGCTQSNNSNDTSNALIVEDGMIKYENNGKVEEVISLEELLSGTNNTSTIEAKEIELFVEDGYIVWNYVGETSVHKLIAVSELVGKQGTTGPKGDTGAQGAQGAQGATGPQGQAGVDGTNAYIWVKYLDNDPAQATDIDLQDETGSYMGIYYGTSSSAPNDIASYKWYNIKGEKGDKGDKGDTGEQGEQGVQGPKGDTGEQGIQGIQGVAGKDGADGQDGTNAYVWIKYAENDPTVSSDVTISDTPNNYMGVYSGNLASAPTEANAYKWFKIKGEKGEQGIQGEKGDQGIQGETGAKGDKGDTGATGPQGEQGPQGEPGSSNSSYTDNIAIFTCTFDETDVQPLFSIENYYIGSNSGITLNDNQLFIMLDTNNNYLIEINGTFYLKSSNLNSFTIKQNFSKGFPLNCLIQNITAEEKAAYTYFGGFSGITTTNSEYLTTIKIDLSGDANYSFSYNCNYTIKITKL